MFGIGANEGRARLNPAVLAGLLIGAAAWAPPRVRGDEPPIREDEARPDVSWREADQVVGHKAFVSGKVVDLFQPRSGRLNLFRVGEGSGEAKEWNFTIVIPTEFQKNFPEPVGKMYTGKLVRAYGLITTYGGKPQVMVKSPEQIHVLESLPATKPPARPQINIGDEITVATYNILNLFDAADDPHTDDEFTGTKPRAELERIAERIRGLNADVIAFQEVESRDYLARFLDVFLPEMGYEVVLYEGNDLRGIDVGLASRLPVGEVRSYRHVKFPDAEGHAMRFRRDLLRARIEPPGADPFEVWVVHLKSKGGGEGSDAVRVGEARYIRKLLDAELNANPEARIIVAGDFNDTWESTAVQTIVGGGSTALQCFFESIPEAERITYNQEPYRSMIDFILCSPGLAGRYVKDSYKIQPGSIDDSGSDHNPVSARFRLR